MKLFFYGSLMQKFVRSRLPKGSTKLIGDDTISGAAMFSVDGRFPAVVLLAQGGRTIKGEVHEVVDPSLLSYLDSYEGFNKINPQSSLYIRETLTTDGGHEVQVYLFNQPINTLKEVESGDWYAHMGGVNGM